MFKKLSRPYQLEQSYTRRWFMCLAFSFFVFVFLFVFRPFGLDNLETNILTVTMGYGLTCFLVMAVMNVAMLPLFPKLFSEEKWTLGRELGWVMVNVAVIGVANTLYTFYIGLGAFSWSSLWIYEFYTLSIGVFPVAASILINETRLNRKFERSSEELNHFLEKEENTIGIKEEVQEIELTAENETFRLRSDELLFMRSADNYVEVYINMQGKLSKKLLRGSLKNMSYGLAGHKQFFRCHKSYLVNLKKVKHVSGNAQGYKLHLPGTEELVPVSRMYNDSIGEWLSVPARR